MATIDRISELLRQQAELDRARMRSGEALGTGEQHPDRRGRKLANFPDVMREAFQEALRMRRRATDVR